MTSVTRLKPFALEAWYEFMKVWRTPGYTVPAITFPLVFYLFFGVLMGKGRGGGLASLATYLVATYGACGVMGAAFHSFGVNVALERGYGWLEVKRASPMPPAAYVLAKILMVCIFGTIVTGGLAAVATVAGGVRLSPVAWVQLGLVLAVGVLPFAAIGLLLGVVCTPNAIGPVSNLAFMGGAFASGLWVPMEALPDWWQRAAVALPPYHYGRLALAAIGVDSPWPLAVHVTALAGATVVALTIAYAVLGRGEPRA